MKKKYYITTPIFYPNGRPHIGHAYNAIAADVIARFQRASGHSVFFLSGTDEHGKKMQQTAEKQGLTPQQLADMNSVYFSQMLETLNCSVDGFVRTTQEKHKQACQKFWQKMMDKGDIYLGRYEGWYSIRQEAYYEESDTLLGDDGKRYEKELGSPVEWQKEESYFFRLSKYEKPLLDYYEQNPHFIAPVPRRNEVISFVKAGLKDLSISRTNFCWGVPVPQDEKHVMYVWVDALTSYLSAIGFGQDDSVFNEFWPANLHVIGKDILRFHAVYWPAFLMSAGLPLPQRLFAHGFLLNRGEKMSKSVGNVVDPSQLVEKYGADPLRYFFMREVPFGQDGSYSDAVIINRINADLANDLGNLAQRSLSMIAKNCKGCMPKANNFFPQDEKLLHGCEEVLERLYQYIEKQELHTALTEVFSLISQANSYFAHEQPWQLRKSDQKRFETVLYVTLEVLRRCGVMLLCFMPQSAKKLLFLLGVEDKEENYQLTAVKSKTLRAGAVLPPPEIIFPRYLEE